MSLAVLRVNRDRVRGLVVARLQRLFGTLPEDVVVFGESDNSCWIAQRWSADDGYTEYRVVEDAAATDGFRLKRTKVRVFGDSAT